MNDTSDVKIVYCHAGGEVGDVVVGGVAPPPGDTLWEQSRFIANDETLRNFLLNEPRGGVFRHVNLLVPAVDPAAALGFIIMEPADTPPMSGSNSICVAQVVLETGLVPMIEPETRLVLEAPGGLVQVTARCRDGLVRDITVENLPSFADRLDQRIDVAGLGEVRVDIAYGGDSFAIVDTAELGVDIAPGNARQLAELGVRISRAATEQLGFRHPAIEELRHISFCLFADPLHGGDGQFETRQAVAIRPGKIDRSPTGTGISARLALLHARGELVLGDRLLTRSIVGSEFVGRIGSETDVGGRKAIRPTITGTAFITGSGSLRRDPRDPWPQGYRLNDTWPGA